MKRSLSCSLLAIAAFGVTCLGTARADEDAKEALKAAQKAQDEAPAYRMKIVSSANDKTNAMTVDMVKPDSVYWKTEDNGQVSVEMWSNGKRTYMRQGPAGEVHESTMDVRSLLTQARQVDPLETLITNAQDLKLVGHEELNGVAASVYTFKSSLMNTESAVKLWISDVDHRPIKSEIDTHREMKPAPVHKKTMVTYDYGSSIKVVVPTK